MIKVYHRTSEANWEKIQKEGVLFGIPHTGTSKDIPNPASFRYTCLSSETTEKVYGPVLLEVEHDTTANIDEWKKEHRCPMYFMVTRPIPLSRVRRIE